MKELMGVIVKASSENGISKGDRVYSEYEETGTVLAKKYILPCLAPHLDTKEHDRYIFGAGVKMLVSGMVCSKNFHAEKIGSSSYTIAESLDKEAAGEMTLRAEEIALKEGLPWNGAGLSDSVRNIVNAAAKYLSGCGIVGRATNKDIVECYLISLFMYGTGLYNPLYFESTKQEPAIQDIVANYYNAGLNIMKKARYSYNPEFELLPVLFIAADIAASTSGKDREKVADRVFAAMQVLYPAITDKELDKRTSMYGKIIRNDSIRGDSLLWNKSNGNAIQKVITIFSDIMYNPACAENYEEAPVKVGDAFEVSQFGIETVNAMVKLITEFYNEIYMYPDLV